MKLLIDSYGVFRLPGPSEASSNETTLPGTDKSREETSYFSVARSFDYKRVHEM